MNRIRRALVSKRFHHIVISYLDAYIDFDDVTYMVISDYSIKVYRSVEITRL